MPPPVCCRGQPLEDFVFLPRPPDARDQLRDHIRYLQRRCRVNQDIKIAFLAIVPMDDETKYARIPRAMRLDDTPDGVTMGVKRCRGFHGLGDAAVRRPPASRLRPSA